MPQKPLAAWGSVGAMSVHVAPPSVVSNSLPSFSVPAKPCCSSRKSVLRTLPRTVICTDHVTPLSDECRISPRALVSQPCFALGHDMSSYLAPMGRVLTNVHSEGTGAGTDDGDCLGPQ